MNKRDTIRQIPAIAALLEDANVVDIKTTGARLSLREFVAGLLTYQPGWMTFLYRVRWGFVRLLGMTQDGVPQPPRMSPDDVPMTPGEPAHFFTVTSAEEDRYWLARTDDKHLSAWLAVVVEPVDDVTRRFYLATIVHHNHWTGPIYFNVICPFHHLIVWAMLRAVVRRHAAR